MTLRFRKFGGDDDLQMIMTWRSKPEVTRYMYTDIEPNLERQREWFSAIQADPSRRDWVIVADGQDVGLLSIYRIDNRNSRCDWAYYLGAEDVRGRGIGKNVELNVLAYVFEVQGLNKLCCEVFAFNEFVVGIHEKYGSSVEGRRRQHVRKGSEFFDVVEMGILADDWRSQVKGKFEHLEAVFEE